MERDAHILKLVFSRIYMERYISQPLGSADDRKLCDTYMNLEASSTERSESINLLSRLLVVTLVTQEQNEILMCKRRRVIIMMTERIQLKTNLKGYKLEVFMS